MKCWGMRNIKHGLDEGMTTSFLSEYTIRLHSWVFSCPRNDVYEWEISVTQIHYGAQPSHAVPCSA